MSSKEPKIEKKEEIHAKFLDKPDASTNPNGDSATSVEGSDTRVHDVEPSANTFATDRNNESLETSSTSQRRDFEVFDHREGPFQVQLVVPPFQRGPYLATKLSSNDETTSKRDSATSRRLPAPFPSQSDSVQSGKPAEEQSFQNALGNQNPALQEGPASPSKYPTYPRKMPTAKIVATSAQGAFRQHPADVKEGGNEVPSTQASKKIATKAPPPTSRPHPGYPNEDRKEPPSKTSTAEIVTKSPPAASRQHAPYPKEDTNESPNTKGAQKISPRFPSPFVRQRVDYPNVDRKDFPNKTSSVKQSLPESESAGYQKGGSDSTTEPKTDPKAPDERTEHSNRICATYEVRGSLSKKRVIAPKEAPAVQVQPATSPTTGRPEVEANNGATNPALPSHPAGYYVRPGYPHYGPHPLYGVYPYSNRFPYNFPMGPHVRASSTTEETSRDGNEHPQRMPAAQPRDPSKASKTHTSLETKSQVPPSGAMSKTPAPPMPKQPTAGLKPPPPPTKTSHPQTSSKSVLGYSGPDRLDGKQKVAAKRKPGPSSPPVKSKPNKRPRTSAPPKLAPRSTNPEARPQFPPPPNAARNPANHDPSPAPVKTEDIRRSLPCGSSAVMQVYGRKLNIDAFPLDGPLYPIMRAWVFDDPFRTVPKSAASVEFFRSTNVYKNASATNAANNKSIDTASIPGSKMQANSVGYIRKTNMTSPTAVDEPVVEQTKGVDLSMEDLRKELVQRAKQVRRQKSKSINLKLRKGLDSLLQKGYTQIS